MTFSYNYSYSHSHSYSYSYSYSYSFSTVEAAMRRFGAGMGQPSGALVRA